MTTHDKYCSPFLHYLTSQNVNDAKKECLDNPSCHMFYHMGGSGSLFRACEAKSSVKASSGGSILYTKQGNKHIVLYLKAYCNDMHDTVQKSMVVL